MKMSGGNGEGAGMLARRPSGIQEEEDSRESAGRPSWPGGDRDGGVDQVKKEDGKEEGAEGIRGGYTARAPDVSRVPPLILASGQ